MTTDTNAPGPLALGFSFIEFVGPDPAALVDLFQRMGFGSQPSGDGVHVLGSGDVRIAVNARPTAFARVHGPSIRGVGITVRDPAEAERRCLAAGAGRHSTELDGPGIVDAPIVHGIGGSLIYLVGAGRGQPFGRDAAGVVRGGAGHFVAIDHLSNIVQPGNMERWADFYIRGLSLDRYQYLNVQGARTGMRAVSMVSEDHGVRVPIAESANDSAGALNQNDEFIRDYGGEGVQHVALRTTDIRGAVAALRAHGIEFMPAPPDTYYDGIDARIPGHGLDLRRLREAAILVDGTAANATLLQIFTRRQVGPIFFEIIQRNGEKGFGAGNFRALFEVQERDQVVRGST